MKDTYGGNQEIMQSEKNREKEEKISELPKCFLKNKFTKGVPVVAQWK